MTKAHTKHSEIRQLYRSYVIGFVLSLALTAAAFLITKVQVDGGGNSYPTGIFIAILAFLAIAQLIVQLLFFFHLGHESRPRLNTVSFLFMLMVVGIIGFGSLWIMYNLNYNMMPHEVEDYIQKEENIQLDKTESEHRH